MRSQTTRTISGRVSAAGAALDGGFTVQKTATGIYNIGLPARPIAAHVSIQGQYVFASTDTFTDRGFRVSISSALASFTGNDQTFSFSATVPA